MYSLIYITTLHPEYLYVQSKRHEEKSERKPKDAQDTSWIKGFESAVTKPIPEEIALLLDNERQAFEFKIAKIVKK